MARTKALIPQNRLHEASGHSVVYARGRTFYLGKFDTPASRQAYGELLTRLAKEALPAEVNSGKTKPVSISELCLRFVNDELPRFSRAEQFCQRTARRPSIRPIATDRQFLAARLSAKPPRRNGRPLRSRRPRAMAATTGRFRAESQPPPKTQDGPTAERPRSPAAAAGEPLNHEIPKCRRGQMQRLVRQSHLIRFRARR